LLPIAIVRKGNAIGRLSVSLSVRSSDCLHSILSTDRLVASIHCMCIVRKRLKIEVIGQGQGQGLACVVGRPRSAAAAESSTRGRDNAVMRSV